MLRIITLPLLAASLSLATPVSIAEGATGGVTHLNHPFSPQQPLSPAQVQNHGTKQVPGASGIDPGDVHKNTDALRANTDAVQAHAAALKMHTDALAANADAMNKAFGKDVPQTSNSQTKSEAVDPFWDEIIPDVHRDLQPVFKHATPAEVCDFIRDVCDQTKATCGQSRVNGQQIAGMPTPGQPIEKRRPPYTGYRGRCPPYHHICVERAGGKWAFACCLDLVVIVNAGDEEEASRLFPQEAILPPGAVCPPNYRECKKRRADKTWNCCCPGGPTHLKHANVVSVTLDASADMVAPRMVMPVPPAPPFPGATLFCPALGRCPPNYSTCLLQFGEGAPIQHCCCIDDCPDCSAVLKRAGVDSAGSDSSTDTTGSHTSMPAVPGSYPDRPLVFCPAPETGRCPRSYSPCSFDSVCSGRTQTCCCLEAPDLVRLASADPATSDASTDMVVPSTVMPRTPAESLDFPVIFCPALDKCPRHYRRCQLDFRTGERAICCCPDDLHKSGEAPRSISATSDPHVATPVTLSRPFNLAPASAGYACPIRHVKCIKLIRGREVHGCCRVRKGKLTSRYPYRLPPLATVDFVTTDLVPSAGAALTAVTQKRGNPGVFNPMRKWAVMYQGPDAVDGSCGAKFREALGHYQRCRPITDWSCRAAKKPDQKKPTKLVASFVTGELCNIEWIVENEKKMGHLHQKSKVKIVEL